MTLASVTSGHPTSTFEQVDGQDYPRDLSWDEQVAASAVVHNTSGDISTVCRPTVDTQVRAPRQPASPPGEVGKIRAGGDETCARVRYRFQYDRQRFRIRRAAFQALSHCGPRGLDVGLGCQVLGPRGQPGKYARFLNRTEEIDTALRWRLEVMHAVLLVRGERMAKNPIGYVVTEQPKTVGDIASFMRETLPFYSLPAKDHAACLSPSTPMGNGRM